MKSSSGEEGAWRGMEACRGDYIYRGGRVGGKGVQLREGFARWCTTQTSPGVILSPSFLRKRKPIKDIRTVDSAVIFDDPVYSYFYPARPTLGWLAKTWQKCQKMFSIIPRTVKKTL